MKFVLFKDGIAWWRIAKRPQGDRPDKCCGFLISDVYMPSMDGEVVVRESIGVHSIRGEFSNNQRIHKYIIVNNMINIIDIM